MNDYILRPRPNEEARYFRPGEFVSRAGDRKKRERARAAEKEKREAERDDPDKIAERVRQYEQFQRDDLVGRVNNAITHLTQQIDRQTALMADRDRHRRTAANSGDVGDAQDELMQAAKLDRMLSQMPSIVANARAALDAAKAELAHFDEGAAARAVQRAADVQAAVAWAALEPRARAAAEALFDQIMRGEVDAP